MVFKIDGVDITHYIKYDGLKWSRNDVDGPNAGRVLSGEMQRDRVAIKYRWDVSCRQLTATEQSVILQLIEPEFVNVEYTDPVTNTTQIGVYYSNNFPSTFRVVRPGGIEVWDGLVFPLIQK